MVRIFSVHAGVVGGVATKEIAKSRLEHPNKYVGTCMVGGKSSMHIGIQHAHKTGEVYTHQFTYINVLKPIDLTILKGQFYDEFCDERCVTNAEACSAAWLGRLSPGQI